jgi:hypothetical protein
MPEVDYRSAPSKIHDDLEISLVFSQRDLQKKKKRPLTSLWHGDDPWTLYYEEGCPNHAFLVRLQKP